MCAYHLTRFCPGRAIKTGNTVTVTRNHNHAPNLILDEERVFLRRLQRACNTQIGNTRDIYDSLQQLYRRAAEIVTWRSQRVNMRRWQKNFISRLPRILSLTHLKLSLQNDNVYNNLTNHSHGSLSLRFRTNFDLGQTTAVMGDSNLINRFDNNSKMFVATTNLVLPAGLDARETLFVLLMNREHVFGVSWAFLPDRSRSSFSAAVNLIFSQIAPRLNPNEIYYDYENGLHDALRENVPAVNLQGTFFAHANILFRRATELELNFGDRDTLIIFKKLLAICLLSPNNVPVGFLWLRANIPGRLMETIENMFEYYYQSWINSVGPHKLSFYDDFDSFSDSVKNHVQNLQNSLENNTNVWNVLSKQILFFYFH
ncbi:uncharacterized protein LOC103578087 [Microplitis demolitor]|uniref:uncharacterized protein LOC103578087 n=1 Tax=Microplitis demolitor TaxID=69319 RepID=UPI00235B6B48|nr:uncharacterized protein LOC103578087 [Microplitis demolitor]